MSQATVAKAEPRPRTGDGARRRLPGLRPEDATIGLILVALIICFGVIAPSGSFLTADNFKNIAVDASELMILAAGITLLLIAGGLDLSVGSVVVFSAVVSAKIVGSMSGGQEALASGEYTHLGLAIACAVAAALVSGLVWGCLNGVLAVKLRIPPFIATLATLGIALGLAEVIAGGINVANIPVPLQENFGLGEALGLIPWPVVIAVVVTAVLWVVLAQTRFGLRTYAIGGNAESARRAGLNVDRHMLVLYALVGFLAGLVAIIDLSRFGTASLAAHSQDALAAIAAVVIGGTSLFGGRGRMSGTVIGVLIPAVLLNGFVIVQIDPFWQNVAVGVVLLTAVYIDQVRRRQAPGN